MMWGSTVWVLCLFVVSGQEQEEDAPFHYPAYCAKVDGRLPPHRTVPHLSAEAQALSSELVQVQALVRHGARAPASKYNCWHNYDPEWNCGLDQVVQGKLSGLQRTPALGDAARRDGALIVYDAPYTDHKEQDAEGWLAKLFSSINGADEQDEAAAAAAAATRFYEKLYDADAPDNVLGGTCQKGQLLAEGFQQHQLIGHLLAKAYQVSSGKDRVPFPASPPLLTAEDYRQEIYFRASDMQRTLLSGSALLTSYLHSVNGLDPQATPIPVHTMDLEREYVFPNLGICPGLRKVREDIFASSGYAELREKYSALEQKIKLAVGRDDISDVWPGEFFDCIMTTLCTGQVDQLPPGLRPEVTLSQTTPNGTTEELSLLNYTLLAVDEYATFEYTWKNSLFSKTAMAKLFIEVKSEMIRALARDISNNGDYEQVDEVISSITGESQYQEFSPLIARHPRFNVADPANPWDAKKLILYAGHDTSIMPFLAAFEGTVFNKKWPPYASEVVLELHRGMKPDSYFFRLIYNGEVLTSEIPGCEDLSDGAADLCRVSTFFTTTSWATPSGTSSLCDGPGVSTPAPATERWLLRRSVPERKATK
eukprot:Gregarina_sp_Pseudo_9__4027@NODE_416_length_2880_cov_199_351637_g393_i0_p1_GENE_NODE_416_length_2880_cov_199_351637_g393_i0NODE_416_length_2880_cov_199_351637_g393_i0_p1_ORF_typecomplete_len594_score69_09His_Phos_2/PF00328_22/4_8e272CSK_N/PF08521_10/0_18_NODE_416_length_2880_cov_199_351637_g393_i06972478